MTVEQNQSLYETKTVLKSEDCWAVWLGLVVFVLGLGPIWGLDLLGWATRFNVWMGISKAVDSNTKTFAALGGLGSAIWG